MTTFTYEDVIKQLREAIDDGELFVSVSSPNEKEKSSQLKFFTIMCNFTNFNLNNDSIDNILFQSNLKNIIDLNKRVDKTIFYTQELYSGTAAYNLERIFNENVDIGDILSKYARTKVYYKRSDLEYYIKLFFQKFLDKYWYDKYEKLHNYINKEVNKRLSEQSGEREKIELEFGNQRDILRSILNQNDLLEDNIRERRQIIKEINKQRTQLEEEFFAKKSKVDESSSLDTEILEMEVKLNSMSVWGIPMRIIREIERKIAKGSTLRPLSRDVNEEARQAVENYNIALTRKKAVFTRQMYLSSFKSFANNTIDENYIKPDDPDLKIFLEVIANNQFQRFPQTMEDFEKKNSTVIPPLKPFDDHGRNICSSSKRFDYRDMNPNAIMYAVNKLFYMNKREIKNVPELNWKQLSEIFTSNINNFLYILAQSTLEDD